MYYKCTWCKAKIISKPIYYTQGFEKLQLGFEVYCDAACSLSAYGQAFGRKNSLKKSNGQA